MLCRRARAVAASLAAERGLVRAGSGAVAHGLNCPSAHGIFPGQGLELCLPRQQAESTTAPPERSLIRLYLKCAAVSWSNFSSKGYSFSLYFSV